MSTSFDQLSLVDRIRAHQDEGNALMRRLRSCEAWKAIQRHIEEAEEAEVGECGLMSKTHDVVHYRGESALSLRKVYAYPPGTETVRFVFDVKCWDEQYEREVDVNVNLDVPLRLLEDFDQKLFDEWVAERMKSHWWRLERGREKLGALLSEYPELRMHISSKD